MAKLSANLTRIVVGVIVLALVGGVAYYLLSGSGDRTVSAKFDEAIGIYPGTPVKILGVPVGTVSSVKPEGTVVKVTMTYDSKYKLPPDVHAIEVANSLVSDRYIELADANGQAYKGYGPSAPNNYSIPNADTASPAELDDIYKALSDLSLALGPSGANKHGALSELLKVASANLKGNGADLGNSITKLSQAAKTLADNSGNLFDTVKNLQQFTQVLQESDATVRHFEQQLAQVASDLASERSDFGLALHDLATTLDTVAAFVKDNAAGVHKGLHGLASVSNILIKEEASLNETLALAGPTLANVVHAYQPDTGTIAARGNLASLTDPGQICKALDLSGVLDTSGITKLLGSLGLGKLLPTVTNTLITTCNSILGKIGKSSASSTKIDPSAVTTIVHAATDTDPVGGLITGGQ